MRNLSERLKLEYNPLNGEILANIVLLDGLYAVSFTARDIWKDKHGVYAYIKIGVNQHTLAFNQMNAYKSEDRVRILNAAYEKMSKTLKAAYNKEEFKSDLDGFCEALWEEVIKAGYPVHLMGRPRDPKTQFILKPYILQDGGTILFGPPGTGKSFLALAMAVMVNEGLSILWPIAQKRVLFLNLERSKKSIEERIWMLKKVLSLREEAGLLTLTARGRSLLEVKDMVREAIRREGVELLIMDSISRAGLGTLVEDRTANAIIDTLNALCPTWLAIAHSPKADKNTVFGSVHFTAGADMVVQIASEQREASLGVGLEVVKTNDIARPPTGIIALEFDEMGLSFIGKASKSDFPELLALRKPKTADEIEALLRERGKATSWEIAEAIKKARSTIVEILSEDSRFVRLGRSDSGEDRRVYYGLRAFGKDD